jgi:hypothetical protein
MTVARTWTIAVAILCLSSTAQAAQSGTPIQAQDIAKQAYIYGFPMVDLYRIMFGYFIDPKSPAYKTAFNTVYNSASVYTPADTTVQTPNSDTPYSFVAFDLRAEPWVLTLPAVEKSRYYSVQMVDQYTFNFDYLGSRTTGNAGGDFLIAGPDWHGSIPKGIKKVVRSETQFAMALIRTQLFGPSDLDSVKKIQAGYAVRPLSIYENVPRPEATPEVAWIAPLSPSDERTSLKFFNVLAFVLRFCPTAPSEVIFREHMALIGIVPDKPFDPASLSTARQAELSAGMAAGQREIDAARAASTSANDLFGTREQMHDNFLNRAVGAQFGILGNTAAEAVYLSYQKDADGKPLVGTNKYAVHFAKGGLPPVHAFWSMTMYDLPQQLLVANPLDRYLINSPMLPTLKQDPDGGITLYFQHDSPGKDKESNWLPAPAGPFLVVLRCYWPEDAILTGAWKQPRMTSVK